MKTNLNKDQQKKRIIEIFAKSIEDTKKLLLMSDIEIKACNYCSNVWDLEFRLSDSDSHDREITSTSEEKLNSVLRKNINLIRFKAFDKGFCESSVKFIDA